MVYCQKCGAENAEEADFCKKCGAPLTPVKIKKKEWYRRDRMEEECFGITGGGAIFGIFFGIIIIGLGFSLVYGWPVLAWIGPVFALGIGLLIIIGALNAIRKKRTPSME